MSREKTEADIHDDEIGKLFADNDDNFVVTMDTYKTIIKRAGGLKTFAILMCFIMSGHAFGAFNEKIRSSWAMKTFEEQQKNYVYYTLLMMGWTVCCMLRDIVNDLYREKASQRMGNGVQRNLLKTVMNAPINLFFDITPIGKIFGRFNGDVDVFKGGIFHGFMCLVGMVTWPMCVLAYLSTISLWTIPFFMCLMYAMHQVGSPYVVACKKMDKVNEEMSHTNHGCKEAVLKGMHVVRAFNK